MRTAADLPGASALRRVSKLIARVVDTRSADGPGRAARQMLLARGRAGAVLARDRVRVAVADDLLDRGAAVGRRLAELAAGVRDALRRPWARPQDPVTDEEPSAPVNGSPERPRWAVVAIAVAIAGGVLAFRLSPASTLYWYAFPLFGIGVAYVIQFRSELTVRWWAVLASSAVVSAVALAQDWAFSGHVLFNVLILGHAAHSRTRRTWIGVLLVSLGHLFVLKVAFQRPMDVVGGVISVVVAIVALALAGPPADPRRGEPCPRAATR